LGKTGQLINGITSYCPFIE